MKVLKHCWSSFDLGCSKQGSVIRFFIRAANPGDCHIIILWEALVSTLIFDSRQFHNTCAVYTNWQPLEEKKKKNKLWITAKNMSKLSNVHGYIDS